MTAILEAVPVTKKKRSDWRTNPRDEFMVGNERLSFVTYLVSQYPRGMDWSPCTLAPIQKLHDTPRDKRGHLSGRPRMRKVFINWLMREHEEHDYKHGEVRAAIQRAEKRDPEALLVLRWRQGLGPCAGISTAAMLERLSLAHASSLTDRLYKAAALVFNEIERGRGGLLDV